MNETRKGAFLTQKVVVAESTIFSIHQVRLIFTLALEDPLSDEKPSEPNLHQKSQPIELIAFPIFLKRKEEFKILVSGKILLRLTDLYFLLIDSLYKGGKGN